MKKTHYTCGLDVVLDVSQPGVHPRCLDAVLMAAKAVE